MGSLNIVFESGFRDKEYFKDREILCFFLFLCRQNTEEEDTAALEVLPADIKAQTKAELHKKAYSHVVLCLGNKVLREVIKEKTATRVWSKLETLYMTKSLANKLYLKKKLYTFYMSAGRKIFEHIDKFNKIVLDLANIKIKFKDEDIALLLLTSLLTSYEHFVDNLLYGREALTLEDVMATLNAKEIKERSKAKGDNGEGLYVRGRTDRRDSCQSRGKSKSKSRDGRLKCYICQSEDHLKRNCLKNNRKKSAGYVKKDDQPSSSGSTSDNLSVLLGDNKECKIRCLGKVRVQLRDGSSFVLHNSGKVKVINGSRVVLSRTRRDNYVYSLDGHAVAGELNTSVEYKDSLVQFQCRKAHYSGSDRLCSFRFIRFKDKAFGKFKEWKQLVKNYTGRTVKKLRMDNGLECCNWEFEQLCVKSRISRHLTVSRMSQQNGLAERYRLYRLDDESPKIVTSRNVVFNESVMYKDTLKDSGASADKSVEELQVEVELQGLNNHMLEEDQTDQEDGNDEDA
ncbi:retrovirus-related pol polyprotein from transposon TNT 1-94 [Tanacetum coccineum]